MTESTNSYGFSAYFLAAYRALNYAIVRACLGTGSLYNVLLNRLCGIVRGAKVCLTVVTNIVVVCVGVTLCCDLGLLYGNGLTNGTLLTVGETLFSTGRCLAGNSFLGVSKCCDFFLRYEYLAASRALLTVGKTLFGTGRCLTGNGFFGVGVTELFNSLGLLITADGTGVGHNALTVLGCGSSHCALTVCMSRCVGFLLAALIGASMPMVLGVVLPILRESMCFSENASRKSYHNTNHKAKC